ncbi:ADP-ribose 1''-phosphate phosphatase [Exophiala xenobiotica]|uniref:ADP-ribose 1''-phosphate phosphatase n=1 Tax=Lithohypha guttulata TaxID=1690604 RepID=A0ABR0JW65_9EURO|nr:ADP-ribose 1''-phosphate phosphatase [Lithohypha guttulata]KAK5310031.1 ADP-ribose 1''-phosphate phosphatase [Exophiala xenobiotica]
MGISNQSSQPLKRKDRDNDLATTESEPDKKHSRKTRSTTTESKEDILPAPRSKFEFQETHRTICNLPDNSILVHATNCVGTWGAGFAKAVKAQYPVADKVYVRHCDSFQGTTATKAGLAGAGLLGTCLLIPPQREGQGTPAVWIACLFTSYSYGKRKDRPEKILAQTKSALGDLRVQLDGIKQGKWLCEAKTKDQDIHAGSNLRRLKRLNDEESSDATANEPGISSLPLALPDMCIYSPKFNAGNFRVPWEDTMRSVEDIFSTWDGHWYLLRDK